MFVDYLIALFRQPAGFDAEAASPAWVSPGTDEAKSANADLR
ncbi:MAG: hypothetical protein JWP29_2569 [Rhodoferax sp.]|nr:hypothetical protein [Rhodoferax sp.]